MTGTVPLTGLRVLDLSRTAAAASCTRILAQLGANIEKCRPEDPSSWAAEVVSRSEMVAIDLEPEEARAVGVEPGRLATPGRVVVSVTPFGGSNRDEVGCGARHDGIESTASEVVAALSGAHAAAASLAALRWARQHGPGVEVDVGALEVLAACQGDLLPPLVCAREPRADTPTRSTGSRTMVLECADGHVGLALPTQVHREDLASLAGVDALREPSTNVSELLGPWLLERTRYEFFQLAQLWRLPVVPVLEPGDVLSDEQNLARGVWGDDANGRLSPRSPFRFTRSGGVEHKPACPGPLPLSDIQVLDLGVVWAGPYCGRILAGLGARVTGIERPARLGDEAPGRGDGCWGVVGDLHRGKDSLVLDLSQAGGRASFVRRAKSSDVVIENFSPRVMPNLGLDYRVLAQSNPGLLMLSMPAFGADGPWANYVTYGSGLELATGLAGRAAGGFPTPAPVPYLDYLAGCYGAVGLLAALLARDHSGEGLHLEVAQREVACQLLATYLDRAEPGTMTWPDPQELVDEPHLARRGFFVRAPPGAGACHHLARLPWRLWGIPAGC